MSATRTVRIEISPEEISLIICGYVRDAYNITVDPKHIEFVKDGLAVVTVVDKIDPKMAREIRPPSRS